MSESEKIVYTAAAAIFGGALTFVVGQIFQSFLLLPIQNLRSHIARIRFLLSYHANRFGWGDLAKKDQSTREILLQTSREFREAGSRLEELRELVPCYRLWAFLTIIPSLAVVNEAIGALIGISNLVFSNEYLEAKQERVEKLLRLFKYTEHNVQIPQKMKRP